MVQNNFVSAPMTAVQIAQMAQVTAKHVSNKMPAIIRSKKAVKISGYKRPAQYVFYAPVHEVFPATNLSPVTQRSGEINYRRFCSDPFRLTKGSR
jgi:hypothetical protein